MANDSQTDLSSLLFYSHNVARALKSSVEGELAHAIHETLHFALDGEPEDYYLQSSNAGNGAPCGASDEAGAQASTSVLSNGAKDDLNEDDQIRPGFFETGDEEIPFISFDWEESARTLILPHARTVTNPTIMDPCTSNEQGRDSFDVTAKFFFLGEGGENASYSSEWVKEALKRFSIATGLDSVDTLILAFGSEDEEQGKRGVEMSDARLEKVVSLWKQLSPDEKILTMGLSDFSQRALQSVVEKLQLEDFATTLSPSLPQTKQLPSSGSSMTSQVQESLIENDAAEVTTTTATTDATHVHIPSSPSKAVFSELAGKGEEEAMKEFGPGPCRRPRLCAINLNDQSNGVNGNQMNSQTTGKSIRSCCWDRGLADYCKDTSILLVAHSDRKDLLPARTLPTLMKEFEGKLPHSIPKGKHLVPLWCFKYTVLIRDRGVLADKG
ncbi:hypothetical protein CBS101457_006257 [Exobasidium rhododendri]|nr:hypothetical protein CBS101457_006257 [Exobasidium rhododendri]